MRDRTRDRTYGGGGGDDRDVRRREWARLPDDDVRDFRGSEDQHPLGGREPASFGMNMPGNFGFDRGGQGLPGASYFGGSGRGRDTSAGLASSHGQTGGDLDRGFAGNSAAGGTDRGYSGGFNYGWGGSAYRSGMAHDRFEESSRLREQEQTMRGSFRGKGPRSFKRDDARLQELVCERLHDADDVDASEIEVAVENSVVRLTGTVPDRRMKRLAEDVAESVGGITDVDNQLRVNRPTNG